MSSAVRSSKLHTYGSGKPDVVYCANNSLRLHPAQQKLIEVTKPLTRSGMLSSADQQQLHQNLCRAIGAKKVLDVGVFTGYSALSTALVLPSDGKVVACDISDEYPKIGIPIWEEAGVADKIELVISPAADTLRSLLSRGEAGTFDFAFIDADKSNYDTYYELCLQLIRPGGIIALDNMLWGGKVFDESVQDNDTVALRQLAAKLHEDERVDISFITIGDGVIFAFKR